MRKNKIIISIVIVLLIASLVGLFLILDLEGGDAENGNKQSNFTCGSELTYRGEEYKTVKIGDQCWFAENLKTKKSREEEEVLNIQGSRKWSEDEEGAFGCYDNNMDNCSDGIFYNFHAVNNYSLCPEGWRVSQDEDWIAMEKYLCNQLGNNNCEDKFSSDKLGWRGDDLSQSLLVNEFNGSNSSGLNISLTGFRNAGGPFMEKEESVYFWSPSQKSNNEYVFARVLEKDRDGIRKIETDKNSGFSIRCVQKNNNKN